MNPIKAAIWLAPSNSNTAKAIPNSEADNAKRLRTLSPSHPKKILPTTAKPNVTPIASAAAPGLYPMLIRYGMMCTDSEVVAKPKKKLANAISQNERDANA